MDNEMVQLAKWILQRRDYLSGRMDDLDGKSAPGIDTLIGALSTRKYVLENVLEKMQNITGIDYLLEDDNQ